MGPKRVDLTRRHQRADGHSRSTLLQCHHHRHRYNYPRTTAIAGRLDFMIPVARLAPAVSFYYSTR